MSQMETLLVLALGSALTLILVLLFGRAFWSMAMAAGARRTERQAPVEMLELQAERDRMRAENALMARKLELRLEDIKMRMAEQSAEVSRNRNRVQGLVEEIERKEETILRKERENASLSSQIDVYRAELATANQTIDSLNEAARKNESELKQMQQVFRKLGQSLREKQHLAGSLSGDIRAAAINNQPFAPTNKESILRQRLAEITAISSDMSRAASEPIPVAAPPAMGKVPEPVVLMKPEGLYQPINHQALSAKMDEAQRLSEGLEQDLKSLSTILGADPASEDPFSVPHKRNKQSLIGNVIRLSQRIRTLQKGLSD